MRNNIVEKLRNDSKEVLTKTNREAKKIERGNIGKKVKERTRIVQTVKNWKIRDIPYILTYKPTPCLGCTIKV
jgi:hypothetical protein